MKIVFASSNLNKIKEVHAVFGAMGFEIVALDCPPPYVEETESTYWGNARLKADAYAQYTSLPCLADDSGIEVDALGGEPGVFSARFSGPNASHLENNQRLLEVLGKEENRKARLVSSLCCRVAEGSYLMADGVISGDILHEPRGTGWGYEPLFFLESYQKSMAELRDAGVIFDTHRKMSLRRMAEMLRWPAR